MSKKEPLLLVTGASGQLGRLVVEALLETVPATRLRALARDPASVADFAVRRVDVREGDYDRPESLAAAFAGVDRVLLISSSDVGHRVPQHRNVITAAKNAGVSLLAYTSILRADTSPLLLASEHLATERELQASGVPFAILRNGWYFENNTAAVPNMLEHGVAIGASGEGRISSAARADYARAAAVVLAASGDENGRIYELAGNRGFTKPELAAEVSRQSGKTVVYQNLSLDAYETALAQFGMPAAVVKLVADSDIGAASGALYDDSGTLSKLIGKPTATLAEAVAEALAVKVRVA